MNKEELKKMAATLSGIADGKAWECMWGEGFDNPCGRDVDYCLKMRIPIRLKPEQQKVPLGPSDVPPGSAIRDSKVPLGRWFLVLSVGPSGLATSSDSLKTFDSLTDGWEIKRLIDTEWEPCYKLIDTP